MSDIKPWSNNWTNVCFGIAVLALGILLITFMIPVLEELRAQDLKDQTIERAATNLHLLQTIEVIQRDGHDYFVNHTTHNHRVFTHSGSCELCEKRQRALFEALKITFPIPAEKE